MKFDTPSELIATIGAVLLAAIILSLLFAFPMMLIWNYALVGAISGVNEVTWVQMWLIMILVNVLCRTSVTVSKKD